MLSLICIYLTHLTAFLGLSVWFVKYLRLGLGTVFLSEIELKKCFWHVLFHLSAWCSYQTFFSTVTRLGLCSHRQLILLKGSLILDFLLHVQAEQETRWVHGIAEVLSVKVVFGTIAAFESFWETPTYSTASEATLIKYIYIYKQVYISFLWETHTYSTASEATLIMYIYKQVYISFLWELPTYSTPSKATLIIGCPVLILYFLYYFIS